MSVLKRKILIGVIILIILIGIKNGFLTRTLVLLNSGIVRISSIEKSTGGPIYQVIFGTDIEGKQKVTWIKRKFFIIPQIVYSIDLEKGITKDKAIEIAKEEEITEILRVQLQYAPSFIQELGGLREGVYWFIEDKNHTYIYIDFITGDKIKKASPTKEHNY